MRASGSKHLRQAVVAAAVLIGAAVAATRLCDRIADSSVDVGIDLAPGETAPILTWASDPSQRRVMEPIDARFAPYLISFEVEAARAQEKNPASTGSVVWLRSVFSNAHFSSPTGNCWQAADEHLVAGTGTVPCLVRVEQLRFSPSITVLKVPYGGKLRLRTTAGSREVDLYDPSEQELRVPLEDAPPHLARYYAQVPRSALASLAIQHTPGSSPVRIFVGSFVPNVFWPARFLDGRTALAPWATNRAVPPSPESGLLTLPSIALLEQGGGATWCAIFLSIVGAVAILLGLAVLAARMWRHLIHVDRRYRALAAFDWRPFIGLFVLFAVPWFATLAAYFPGAMTYDSIHQWGQAHSGPITNLHPALHTILIRLLTRVWDSPAAIASFQIVAMAAALAYALCLLRRLGVPRAVVLVAALLVAVSPRNANMAIVLWKDTLFSVVMLLLAVILAARIAEPAAPRRVGRWLIVGALLGLTPLLRHNGLAVFVAVGACLPVVFWRRRAVALVGLASALLVYLAAVLGLFRWMNVVPNAGVAHYYYSHHIAALVAADVPMSEREYESFERVHSFEDRWSYLWESDVPTINTTLYHWDYAIEHIAEYGEAYRTLVRRYPLLLARHVLRLGSFLFTPSLSGGSTALEIVPNDYGLRSSSRWESGRAALDSVYAFTVRGRAYFLFWRSAYDLYAALLAFAVLLWRTRDLRWGIVFLPVWANTAGLLLLGTAQDHRYQYALSLSLWFLLALMFVPRPRPGKAAAAVGPAPGDAPGAAV